MYLDCMISLQSHDYTVEVAKSNEKCQDFVNITVSNQHEFR